MLSIPNFILLRLVKASLVPSPLPDFISQPFFSMAGSGLGTRLGQGSNIQLYKSTVLPLLDYCSCTWDHYQTTYINMIEGVQKFAARLATKQWNTSYIMTSLPGLFSQLDASSRSYSCATAFYPATQSSHHPASYLHPSPTLRHLHHLASYLFTDLSPDLLPILPLFSQVSYRYRTTYPWTLFFWHSCLHCHIAVMLNSISCNLN